MFVASGIESFVVVGVHRGCVSPCRARLLPSALPSNAIKPRGSVVGFLQQSCDQREGGDSVATPIRTRRAVRGPRNGIGGGSDRPARTTRNLWVPDTRPPVVTWDFLFGRRAMRAGTVAAAIPADRLVRRTWHRASLARRPGEATLDLQTHPPWLAADALRDPRAGVADGRGQHRVGRSKDRRGTRACLEVSSAIR